MNYILLIAAMSVFTFITRYSMIAILGRWKVSPDITLALAFVPIAAFAAIAAPELVLRNGQWAAEFANPRWLAGIAAIGAAYLSRNVILTLGIGMGVMWLAQIFVK